MLARLRWRVAATLRSIPIPACEPILAVERSTRGASVCIISIREIFVFEYQTQRLPSNWRQWSTQICDIARLGARRACYEERTHTVRQRFPSRLLKPFPHTQGFDHTPRGLIKKGRSFPTTGLIFSASLEGRRHCGAAMASCGAMNLIYPEPNSR
jgi:hypothetical protein